MERILEILKSMPEYNTALDTVLSGNNMTAVNLSDSCEGSIFSG